MTDFRRRAVDSPSPDALAVARGLGWFSIALGMAELAAPRRLASLLGMQREAPVIRAYGVREIATGVAILAGDDPRPWIWSRIGGDLLDLATLGVGLRRGNPERVNVGAAIATVLTVTAVDIACAVALSKRGGGSPMHWR